jgi:hypothetical protein
VRAQGAGGPLSGRLRVVCRHEAGADEQDVADLDVAALRGGADVQALRFAAGDQLRERDLMALVRVWLMLLASSRLVMGEGARLPYTIPLACA